jgi:hypothetical protein
MRQTLLFLFLAAACLGCDPLANPVSGRIAFSADTVSFDTVFSGAGSATLEFRAVNPGKDPLLINHIWLGGGEASPFSLNINGSPAEQAEDLVLASGDSIFVFVIVTIDPTGEDNPMAVLDSVNFRSGSYVGKVILEAWGQDIWLVDGDILSDVTWSEGKPYVISGSLFVDTLATLTLDPGTRVYFHHDAGLTVAGSLQAAGTADKPVLFATDRLEDVYYDVPGRWKGISFLGSSNDNYMSFAEVRNAIIALTLTGSTNSMPDLNLNSVSIMHNTVASLVARNAELFAVNSVFAHSGFSTLSLAEGGRYDFVHCTMVNRWEYGFRSEPVMFISPGTGVLPDVSVVNSVIYGTLADEIDILATPAGAAAVFRADSSMIRVDTVNSDWYSSSLFRDVITTGEAGFIDESGFDFRPDTLSPLLDIAGKTEMALWPYDIRNKPRPTGKGPDIGAYERQPGERRAGNRQ